eukprot:scaffold3671_cov61-Phaeocystis_antarctica.AAC.6
MQQLRSSTSPNSHMHPCRYPSSNAVRSFSRASSARTRFLGSCSSHTKFYENRGKPKQAIIVHGLDVDNSHAMGRPSSESRSFAHGGACPLQWLPVLLTV